jgi:hypothetical protein
MSTHAKRIKSWLNEAKKTCQTHFLEVEAKLKKECGYIAHQLVIFNGVDLTISKAPKSHPFEWLLVLIVPG